MAAMIPAELRLLAQLLGLTPIQPARADLAAVAVAAP